MRQLNNNYLFLLPLLMMLGCTSLPVEAVKENADNVIILLHGLSRSSTSMKSLEKHLSNYGFKVININYPSTKYPIEELVEQIAEQLKQKDIESANQIHFVTHSMGGIITRLYLKKTPPKNLGRVVMLSPPNQGSELVDTFKNNVLFKWINGPAGQQLSTEPTSVPNQLGAVKFELGVIMGNSTLNPLYSFLIPGEDDGKVSVERAQVEGMSDFLVLPHSHTFIMNSNEVISQVIYFLENGLFRR